MNLNFKSLEFDSIKQEVAKHSSFSLGQKAILEEQVHFEELWVSRELRRGKEALQLYEVYRAPSFAGVRDIKKPLHDVIKNRLLHPQDIYEIAQFARACAMMKQYQKESEVKAPSVWDIMDSLQVYPSLIAEIERCISPQWEVQDSASTELKTIRKNIRQCESDIAKTTQDFIARYHSSLMDTITATRNGRTCVLVKTSDKNKIKGFVHGESASGQAVYIEPESLLRLNNKRQTLLANESEEIQRILKVLCATIAPHANALLMDLESITLLDALFAKARWAYERNGVYATLSKQPQTIYLKSARHPLIEEEKVVSNTYSLRAPYQHLLITGSNTGGKTVTLKTIGLFTIMTLAGFPVLCEEAEISCFDGVYVDIGDSQSIVESLSTFSAHLATLAFICKQATSNSLVLLDELGSGTDPQEGECLAIATLDYFKDKNIMSVATTHYAKLKEYAKQEKNILLASVTFDLEKMRPTYHYLEGYSGQSNALEIAQRYHLQKEIVERAYALKEANKSEEQRLMEHLDADFMRMKKQEEELQERLRAMEEKETQLQKERQELLVEKDKILNEAEKKALQLQEDAKEKADAIIEELRQLQSDAKEHELISIKAKLNEVESEIEEEEEKQYTFKEKDYVALKKLGYHGEILSIKGNRATVFSNGMKMNVKTTDLEPTHRPVVKSISAHSSQVKSIVPRECNLIGMRVEEALRAVDAYLDHALHSRVYSVRVIHGHGTGALRTGIHQYLKNNKLVDSYRLGGEGEGGLGATIVSLKRGKKNG